MTTVGVVGHTGFVGQAVMRAGERRNVQMVAVPIERVEEPGGVDLDVVVEVWRQKPGWKPLVERLRNVDTLVNAAGAPRPDASDERFLWSANVVLPAIVARACTEAGVHRLVHVSTAAVQGSGSLDEELRWEPFSAYSRSKTAAERYLSALDGGSPAVVIYRPTSVMGHDRTTTRRLAKRCAGLVPVGSKETALPLAHVDNVGDAAVFLAMVDNPPRVALHPREGVTIDDLVRWSGGRTLAVPEAVRRASVAGLRAAARIRPGLAGGARRLEVLFDGQDIQASALSERGWLPPAGKDGYQALFAPSGRAGPLCIAFLITRSDTVGGAHIHVRDIARALLDLGHDAHVLIGADGPYGDLVRSAGIPVTSVPSLIRPPSPRADWRALGELSTILADLDPEVLSTHSSKAGVLGRLAGRRHKIPTLFTAHGWAFTDGVDRGAKLLYQAVELAAAPLASRIVCVSEHDRRLAHRVGIDRLAPTLNVPNAVADVGLDLRAVPGATPLRLIMVARLDDQKCQHEVLSALGGIADRPFTIDFVGDGPRQGELEGQAATLGIGHKCRFLGLRDDVASLLALAQVFVLMSNYEGMPRSVLEAMRAGLPVVASRNAGIPEVVIDGETGMVVEPHDVAGLARALTRLFDDPDLRTTMGSAGRKRYEQNYDLGRLVADMVNVYSDVVKRPLAGCDPQRR